MIIITVATLSVFSSQAPNRTGMIGY